MREIKCRAYNTSTRVMIDLQKITPLALDSGCQNQPGVFIPFDEKLILLFYTGRHDIRGQDIYDGDKVNALAGFCAYEDKGDYKVMWNDAECGFYLYRLEAKTLEDWHCNLSQRKIEALRLKVFGNIYED